MSGFEVKINSSLVGAERLALALSSRGVTARVVGEEEFAEWAPYSSADALHQHNGCTVGYAADGRVMLYASNNRARVEVLYLDANTEHMRGAMPVAVVDAPPSGAPESVALNETVRASSYIVGSQWARVAQMLLREVAS